MIDLPPQDAQQTIAAVVACGVPRAQVRIEYEEELQLDVLRIGKVGGAGDRRLRCILQAVHPVYAVEIADPREEAAYWTLALEHGRARARAEGEIWLRQRGLFDALPRYRAGADVTAYARAVEAHCGVESGTALTLADRETLTVRAQFLDGVRGRGGDELACLTNVLAASGLAEGGVNFGFIGGEEEKGRE